MNDAPLINDAPMSDTPKFSREKIISIYEKYMMFLGSAGQALFYLQAYKIFQLGRSEDVSLPGFAVSFVSLTSWLVYGMLIGNKPLVIVNIVGMIGAALTLAAIIVTSFFPGLL